LRFGKGDWRSFERGIEKEWLVTNGQGSYASSTLIGANTRKYHGLLVAALEPPGQRNLFLAKLDERFETEGQTYNLATNQTVWGVTEFGFVHLQAAVFDFLPTFIINFSDITIHKKVFMVYGENTTVIIYHIQNGATPALLHLFPLVNCRDFHGIVRRGQVYFQQTKIPYGTIIKTAPEKPALHLVCSDGEYQEKEDWFLKMFYQEEEERGFNAVEDHYLPGQFLVKIAAREEKIVTFLATLEEVYALNGSALLQLENKRHQQLISQAGFTDKFAASLVLAADAFIVHRQTAGGKSIIAGYPWFNDWGRDAMIALPGLTLVTKRFAEAKEILTTFTRYCKNGLLPNVFSDAGKEPWYNTVDASLWFFQAVYKYLQYTADYQFIREEIYPVLKEITAHYIRGTSYHIKMAADGLIAAGSPKIQLTWMDAKIGDWVVTPRHGKAVEINALWYNALNILKELAQLYEEEFSYPGLPEKVKESFNREFWFAEGGYLYDVVNEEGKEVSMRPNQVIALSLPYSMLGLKRGQSIIQKVWPELYTAYGLRSLSFNDPAYQGVYKGSERQRDSAYHQGTVWSWLIGPFITAFRKVNNYSPLSKRQAYRFIQPFKEHLREHGIGYISEIFDGNEPLIPRGCIAQAWGVAEVLRAYVEDVLEIKPEKIRIKELKN
jgi:predicted glycogen debranching enzyme